MLFSRMSFLLLLSPLILQTPSFSPPLPAPTPPGHWRIVGGQVADGTGGKLRSVEIRIVGDTIVEVGKHLKPHKDELTIRADGLVIAPGFIDAHSHADGGLKEDPLAETQIRQGITTAIVGQDGGSNVPLSEWFDSVEKTQIALNVASFAGHGTARGSVIGKENRPATPEEIVKMKAFVEREMRAGALGLSTGLEYVPGRYGDMAEVIALAQTASEWGGLYISHVRNEDNTVFSAFEELRTIAERAHLPAQISHIKLGSAKVWGKTGEVFRLMSEGKKHGLDISADVYPYTYWQSTIRVIIPTEDFGDRKLWEAGLADVGGAGNIRLTTYSPDKAWEGKTLAEIAALTGKEAITLAQEIVENTKDGKGRESVVVTAMSEDDLRKFVADPRIMFCSDGGLHPSHPRGAGTFPRILGEYVRVQHTLSLVEAIRKMTSLPAKRFGLSDRGRIAPGMKADLVIFDPNTVQDTATVQNPASAPLGIKRVIVNGVSVLEEGKETGARPGRALRKSNSKWR